MCQTNIKEKKLSSSSRRLMRPNVTGFYGVPRVSTDRTAAIIEKDLKKKPQIQHITIFSPISWPFWFLYILSVLWSDICSLHTLILWRSAGAPGTKADQDRYLTDHMCIHTEVHHDLELKLQIVRSSFNGSAHVCGAQYVNTDLCQRVLRGVRWQ